MHRRINAKVRVVQVLVGTHVVLANGGIMAPVGTHIVALAAKHHSCPFVVLTGLHKLSPLFPHDPSVNFNEFGVSFCDGPPTRVA